jgi:sugar (pentulose or hexulose) kinase
VAGGAFGGAAEAVAGCVRVRETVDPVREWVEPYREARSRFRELYPALRAVGG